MKFVIIFLISTALITLYNLMFGSQYSKIKERKEITYKVTASQGIIGCLTEDKFREVVNFYRANDFAAVQKMIADGACFSFKQGDELTALSETCDASSDDNDAYAFKSDKVVLREVYLPCFAVR